MASDEQELFNNNFDKWLESHGVVFEQREESKGFHAMTNINTLKAAIIQNFMPKAAVTEALNSILAENPESNGRYNAIVEIKAKLGLEKEG